jgi:hypothetical protein
MPFTKLNLVESSREILKLKNLQIFVHEFLKLKNFWGLKELVIFAQKMVFFPIFTVRVFCRILSWGFNMFISDLCGYLGLWSKTY